MHGEGAGSSSAAAAAARQGWAAAIARPLNPALQAFDKWLAAHEARIPLSLCVA